MNLDLEKQDSPQKEIHKSLLGVGWIAGVGAYLFWALMPLFWRLFEGVDPFIVFLFRAIWAFPFLYGLSFVPYFKSVQKFEFGASRSMWLLLSALLIGGNWWIYVIGVSSHRVVEMSLGYFISPLLSSSLGVVLLKERLRLSQWVGVILVFFGVLFYSFHVGEIPLMAIGLALTFSFYSLIRKAFALPAMTALLTEFLILFLLAMVWILISGSDGQSVILSEWTRFKFLFVLSGAMTALPLLWFAFATQKLSMTTMGMLNYISPTGKFLLAVLVFGESVLPMDLLFFAMIWTGIGIYLYQTVSHRETS
ncbi:MAG: EamA family transporter RarD [Proteobacteria bacterium]|nr:EamA family transporter RarD [Pseudomonadota bacterium]